MIVPPRMPARSVTGDGGRPGVTLMVGDHHVSLPLAVAEIRKDCARMAWFEPPSLHAHTSTGVSEGTNLAVSLIWYVFRESSAALSDTTASLPSRTLYLVGRLLLGLLKGISAGKRDREQRAQDPLGYIWELGVNLVVVHVVVAGPLEADLKVAVAILTSFDQSCMCSPLMLLGTYS